MSGVPFELYAGQQLVGGPQTPASGQYSFPDVPVGEVTVAESLPDGYDYGLVFCSYHPADQANGNTPDPVSLTDGTYFSWTMEADYVLECVWFNFGEGDGGTNWIDFYKYECAWNTPTDENADYYQQECALVDDWDFDAQWDGGGSTKTTDGSGLASWEGVPTGSWTGSESVPDGYGQPIVYCRYVEWPDEAGYDNNWFPNDPSGGELSYQFEYDNVRIECYWFNFLPEDGGNQVDFIKYDCAFDTPHDEGKGYYEQECQPRASWDLDLQWDGGGETKATGDDGGASWTGLPQGEWTGSETIAEGYGEPLVWCRYVEWPDEASYNQDWESFPVQGAAFTHDFEYDAGVRIECHIYNFPPDGEGSWIEFYKYVCDEDTAYDTDPGTLASECALAPEYTFSVQSGDYNEEKTTDGSGFASWEGVPTGAWTATETLPEGYGDPIVYCRYTDWSDEATGLDDGTFLVDASGGQWSGDFGWDGTRIVCGIFNIPGEGSWIDFYKYTCPTGTTYDGGYEYYEQECSPYADGARFDLTWTDGGANGTTDGEGYVSWPSVPAGSWQARETILGGYGDPVVFCRWVEWPDEAGLNGDWTMYEAPGGVHDNTFDYTGMRIECYWFNIEYEQNWLDVTKWQCAETVTMPYEQSADNLAEECERYTEDIDLTLEYTGGSELLTTDGDGNAEWGDLPTGPWSLHEDVPDGYGNPVVWCRWIEWPEGEDLTNDPVTYGAPGGSFSGEFAGGGYRLHCDIFNIVDYDPGWVTVYKWYCAIGISTDSSAEYLRDECDLVTTGVDFSLQYGETSAPMTTDTVRRQGRVERRAPGRMDPRGNLCHELRRAHRLVSVDRLAS